MFLSHFYYAKLILYLLTIVRIVVPKLIIAVKINAGVNDNDKIIVKDVSITLILSLSLTMALILTINNLARQAYHEKKID